jgi:hypothetical protein
MIYDGSTSREAAVVVAYDSSFSREAIVPMTVCWSTAIGTTARLAALNPWGSCPNRRSARRRALQPLWPTAAYIFAK